MRRLIPVAALLALSACNRDQQSAETTGIDQNVTVEAIGGNDITAIDAATNDAANMAADSELTLNAALSYEIGSGNEFTGNLAGGNEQ